MKAILTVFIVSNSIIALWAAKNYINDKKKSK